MDSKIRLKPSIYICATLMLLSMPVRWLFSWLLAATVHELCHYVCIRLMGGQIFRVDIGFSGAKMYTAPLSGKQEAISAVAGPVGSLLLLLAGKWLPLTATIGLLHGLYNMLPIYPLDGGRVLRVLLSKCKNGHILESGTVYFVALFLTVYAVYITVKFSIGPLPLAVVLAMIAVPTKKYLANMGDRRYNRDILL